ncbi:MAG: hypothetical protein O3A95_07660 [Planctomycetota bacterium]|nr:hypothetical protein [Planctomycetota bacterium]MDA1114157.1 hypothetical protein [Planctomycetota bacterium]
MVGLILWLWGIFAPETTALQGPLPERHVERVRVLLSEPHPERLPWRKALFQSLTRVEHGPPDLVREGWVYMAAEGTDTAQANFILYCRRQGLPLPEIRLTERANSDLERALSLWGEGRLSETQEALKTGLQAYSGDSRFRGNLDWLSMDLPNQVSSVSTTRELAQAVLATRISRL